MALYDYGNTRLRARLSRLQSIETLETFSDLTSIDSLISALTKTSYQESIETALTYAHGYSCVAEAMRSELNRLQVVDKDYENMEVDEMLIQLAKEMKGKIVTTDYNLNKVATVKGVEVLNINQLANALKPAVMPGEEMTIQVIRSGKEQGQGVAYLDDGTMIVVDGGRDHVGLTVSVVVTSVLQTAAGRMVFAKMK